MCNSVLTSKKTTPTKHFFKIHNFSGHNTQFFLSPCGGFTKCIFDPVLQTDKC